MKRPRRSIIVLGSICLLALAGGVEWWQFTRPHVYRKAVSPDGSWSVTVLRQRVYPYVQGVDVIVEIRDRTGQLLDRETIGNEDLWEDVDEMYPMVECTNDSVHVSCPDCSPELAGKAEWAMRKPDAAR